MAAVDMQMLKFSVKSGRMAARTALEHLLTALAPLNLDPEESGTVELVVAEALNNIVEHAYPEGQPDGPIHLICDHLSDGLHLTLVDHGQPMPEGQTPVGAPANVDVDFMDLPEGGFGWFLIKDLAKDVQYEHKDLENRLSFRLAVATNAAAS